MSKENQYYMEILKWIECSCWSKYIAHPRLYPCKKAQHLYAASDWKVCVRKFPILSPAHSPLMIGPNISKLHSPSGSLSFIALTKHLITNNSGLRNEPTNQCLSYLMNVMFIPYNAGFPQGAVVC